MKKEDWGWIILFIISMVLIIIVLVLSTMRSCDSLPWMWIFFVIALCLLCMSLFVYVNTRVEDNKKISEESRNSVHYTDRDPYRDRVYKCE